MDAPDEPKLVWIEIPLSLPVVGVDLRETPEIVTVTGPAATAAVPTSTNESPAPLRLTL